MICIEEDFIMVMQDQAWNGFAAGEWQRSIDVRSFIQKTPF